MRKSAIAQLLVIFAIIMCYLYLKAAIKQDKLENDEQISNHNHQSAPQWSREIYDQWHDCVMKNLTHYRGYPETVGLNILNTLKNALNCDCDKEEPRFAFTFKKFLYLTL